MLVEEVNGSGGGGGGSVRSAGSVANSPCASDLESSVKSRDNCNVWSFIEQLEQLSHDLESFGQLDEVSDEMNVQNEPQPPSQVNSRPTIEATLTAKSRSADATTIQSDDVEMVSVESDQVTSTTTDSSDSVGITLIDHDDDDSKRQALHVTGNCFFLLFSN